MADIPHHFHRRNSSYATNYFLYGFEGGTRMTHAPEMTSIPLEASTNHINRVIVYVSTHSIALRQSGLLCLLSQLATLTLTLGLQPDFYWLCVEVSRVASGRKCGIKPESAWGETEQKICCKVCCGPH